MTEQEFDGRAMIDNGGESGAIVTSFACSVKAPGTPRKTLVAALARPRSLPRPGRRQMRSVQLWSGYSYVNVL